MSEPDAQEARRRYDEMAPTYDRGLTRLRRFQEGLRRDAVGALGLLPGARVLDIGCGTGASFGRLVRIVGDAGRVVGVDQSAGMLDVARRRIAAEGWTNVQLVDAPVQDAALPDADAALFFFTHDLMRTPAALDNVVAAVRPDGRVVTCGARRPSLWLAPVALPMWAFTRRFVTTSEGLARPWDLLADRLVNVAVDLRYLGTTYLVTGTASASSGAR
jgi:ubiquinone/menaquinone biosynthesis C-methylase UbiE